MMLKNVFFALGTLVLLAVTWYYLPFHAPYTVSVTGTAKSAVSNNMSSFNATVSETNEDKQTALDAVNKKMAGLIKSLKDFGIPDADIKTQQVSVYQQPEVVPMRGSESPSPGSGTTPNGAQTLIYPVPPGAGKLVWYASNSIDVTVRDVSKVSQVSDILNKAATSVYGPNLGVDQNTQSDVELLTQAINDAKSKAEAIAKANGQRIGRMVSVNELGSNYPLPLYGVKDASVGTPIEPGTSNLSKSVNVVFELR